DIRLHRMWVLFWFVWFWVCLGVQAYCLTPFPTDSARFYSRNFWRLGTRAVTMTFFPLRLRAISQTSSLGINPSSRWKKLLIRSYPLPVLWTLIRNRVTPSSVR